LKKHSVRPTSGLTESGAKLESITNNPGKNENLRRRAEEALRAKPATNGDLSGEEIQRLIHELQVHQIELEMQNEALRQTQEELESARDGYLDLFELAPVGYLMLSKKGVIREANLAAANLLGTERNRMKKTPLTHFIFREDQDTFYLGSRKALQENSGQEFELRMVTKDGKQIDVSMRCTGVEAQGRATGQMRVTLSDITGRKQQERALKAYANRLERVNKDLEDFAAVVSHDLKEPIFKIKGFGNILLKDFSSQLGEQGCDYLERMQNSANRMEKLIEALLALSRLSTRAPDFQQVDLNRIAQEVIFDLDRRIQQTGGRIELGQLPGISAEPTQMQQLFMNLIGNALKYHKPEIPPVIKIDARMTSTGEIEIHFADNGIGFDQEAVTRLFKPFVRLVGKNEYEGTGIGLAICRKIVENHAGKITARSAVGQGATFIVTLPIQQPGFLEE